MNLTQAAQKEEVKTSPRHDNHSPLSTPTRAIGQPKYHHHISSQVANGISRLSGGAQILETEHFSDSNGAGFGNNIDYEHGNLITGAIGNILHTFPGNVVFIHAPPEDSGPYYHPDLYYTYNDPESSYSALTGSVTPQNRPFSASSSSCSSIDSGTTDRYSHTIGVNPLAGMDPGTANFHCFNAHSPSQPPSANWNTNVHHPEFKHEFAHHVPNPAYTSVIVDSQQYQINNEFVH